EGGSASGEVGVERQPGARDAVGRFEGDRSYRAHRSVDAAECDLTRRVMLGDFEADVAFAAGHAAPVGRSRADARRAVGLDLCAHDVLLPLAVPTQVIDVGEDVFRPAVDLNAVDDRHPRFLLIRPELLPDGVLRGRLHCTACIRDPRDKSFARRAVAGSPWAGGPISLTR